MYGSCLSRQARSAGGEPEAAWRADGGLLLEASSFAARVQRVARCAGRSPGIGTAFERGAQPADAPVSRRSGSGPYCRSNRTRAASQRGIGGGRFRTSVRSTGHYLHLAKSHLRADSSGGAARSLTSQAKAWETI